MMTDRDRDGVPADPLEPGRMCQFGEGSGPERDAEACPLEASNITEEGYAYCAEHARSFYAVVAILEGLP